MRVKRWMPVAGLLVVLAAAAFSGTAGSDDAGSVADAPTPTLTESFQAAQGPDGVLDEVGEVSETTIFGDP
jgi:hypothetical protein